MNRIGERSFRQALNYFSSTHDYSTSPIFTTGWLQIHYTWGSQSLSGQICMKCQVDIASLSKHTSRYFQRESTALSWHHIAWALSLFLSCWQRRECHSINCYPGLYFSKNLTMLEADLVCFLLGGCEVTSEAKQWHGQDNGLYKHSCFCWGGSSSFGACQPVTSRLPQRCSSVWEGRHCARGSFQVPASIFCSLVNLTPCLMEFPPDACCDCPLSCTQVLCSSSLPGRYGFVARPHVTLLCIPADVHLVFKRDANERCLGKTIFASHFSFQNMNTAFLWHAVMGWFWSAQMRQLGAWTFRMWLMSSKPSLLLQQLTSFIG